MSKLSRFGRGKAVTAAIGAAVAAAVVASPSTPWVSSPADQPTRTAAYANPQHNQVLL